MLGLMRKHAGNWIIKILLGAIAVAFALSWGVYNYGDEGRQIAVKVNDQPIMADQVQDEYARMSEQARQQFGNQFDQVAPFLNLMNRATDRLIDQVLLAQAAANLGIVVSDAEVAAKVASTPAFQRNGAFDIGIYRRILANNRLTPESYEAAQRDDIKLAKLSALVAGSAQVTPLEVEEAATRQLSQIRGVYLVFKPAQFADKIEVTDADAKAYYESHLANYQEPERISFQYLVFPLADQRDQVQVLDQEIEEAYEADGQRYHTPEMVHARHILLKLPEDAAQVEVDKARAQAEDILKQAQAPGADFAELAKKYSQGPTASKGGDLGSFPRGSMVGPFEQMAFSLAPGQMGVVRTTFGFHVIKVEEKKPASQTPLAQVRGEIKQQLADRRAREMAQAAAERAFDRLVTGGDLASLAKENKASTNTSPLVAEGDDVAGLPGLRGMFQASQGLGPGQVVPPVPFEGGSVLAIIKERVQAHPKPFEKVAEDVRVAVREVKSTEMARQTAQDLLTQLKGESDPAAKLKAAEGAKETGWLGAEGVMEGLAASQALVEALFLQPQTQPVLPQPVSVGDGFAAAVLAERRPPAQTEVEARREPLAKELLAGRQRQVVQLFLEDLRAAAQILVPVTQVRQGFKLPGCDAGATTVWVPRVTVK